MTERFLPQEEATAEAVFEANVTQAPDPEQISTPDAAIQSSETMEPNGAEPSAGFTAEAFEVKFSKLTPRLIYLLTSRGVTHQTAEDIVQESFISIWRARDRFEEVPDNNYFFRTVINRHISSLRKMQAQPHLDEELPLPPVYDDTSYIERTLDTRQAIRQQAPHFHALGELLMLGFTYHEIGEVLDINPGTVRTRANRLRKYLQEADTSQEPKTAAL